MTSSRTTAPKSNKNWSSRYLNDNSSRWPPVSQTPRSRANKASTPSPSLPSSSSQSLSRAETPKTQPKSRKKSRPCKPCNSLAKRVTISSLPLARHLANSSAKPSWVHMAQVNTGYCLLRLTHSLRSMSTWLSNTRLSHYLQWQIQVVLSNALFNCNSRRSLLSGRIRRI